MWVFDPKRQCMLWANPAGVAFWHAASLAEFLARDFSNPSEATITRNMALLEQHASGQTGRSQWTVYPKGQPVTLNAHSIGVQLTDGSVAILYEALAVPKSVDASVLRGVEAMQHTSVLVALYRLDGRMVMCNPSAVRALGVTNASTQRDAFAALFTEPALAQTIRQTVHSGQVYSDEVLLTSLSGPRWYGLDARQVPDPVTGEALLQINARDISDLKTTQAALHHAKEVAEAANLAKSQFLATMSHEIRTPMNGILGMAQLLLMPDLADSERHDYAHTILSSGQTLLSLLNDILDLSKIEAGKFQLESRAFEAAQLMDEIGSLFAGAAKTKNLQLNCQWHGPTQQRYQADAHRLHQMLSNLVGNAIKFTLAGHIDIEGRELERTPESAWLEFSVRDTGIGIAPHKLKLLFLPFSQTDSSTTREFGGSGLGLSIVRNLAQAMGGDVGVDSVAGEGSRFWFRLRAQVLTLCDPDAPDQRAMPTHMCALMTPAQLDAHVLVVEDNAVNRMVIQSFLGKLGLRMTLAHDGQQALDVLLQSDPDNAPDLVLMDLHMPVMDGYTATERIRQWEAAQAAARPRLPILALTADAFEEDRQHCLAIGMDDFLTKPITLAALTGALARWLPVIKATATATALT